MRPTAVLLTSLALLDCQALPSEPTQRTESLDAPFELRIGEDASIPESLHLTFRDVVRDSRCPADVQCIRAGEAVLIFDVVVSGREPESAQIDVPPEGGSSAAVGSYTLHVERLVPGAISTRAIDKDEYRATLRVTTSPTGS